jgi:pimeloyl-ACP methyl ester carboxylesterase
VRESQVFPLVPYGGLVPPTPSWFASAVRRIPEPVFITVEGSPIEMYVWGQVAAPGILFLHGNRAHAGWWNFLAPYLSATHRVASISWSGMGASGWRARYSLELHAREALAGAEFAGLFADAKRRPVLVAHSFGARPALLCAREWGERLAGCIVVDSGLTDLRGRGLRSVDRKVDRKLYASETEALARFRLAPSQPCANAYIVDFLARQALTRVQHPVGWSWHFDPAHAAQMTELGDETRRLQEAACRIAFIYGAQSTVTPEAVRQAHRSACRANAVFASIAAAGHHVMVDQPLLLLNEIRSILERWSL